MSITNAQTLVDKASKNIDAMATCTRVNLILVILKAASFFDPESPEGREYYSLMAEIFKIDLGNKGFKINHYIKREGLLICTHLKFLHEGLDAMSKHYGVLPSNSNMDW